jgi:hypothetical protein
MVQLVATVILLIPAHVELVEVKYLPVILMVVQVALLL